MLKNSFYSIKKSKHENLSNLYFEILLNPEHEIYNGHFPNQAVVPGVVSMQIIKELLESATSKKLQLKKSANTKFLSVITPYNNPFLQIEINIINKEQNTIKISAQIKDNKTIFLKLKAEYTYS